MASVQCIRHLFDRNILIDYFCRPRNTPKSTIITYFMSHLHSDHSTGLKDGWHSGTLYCSADTKRLLDAAYSFPTGVVVPLELFRWRTVSEDIRVALLPAHHCFGSVMFVFDFGNIIVVNTGDYRLHPDQLNWTQWPKKIDWLMIDSTYHNPKWSLPTYEESMIALEDLYRQHHKITLQIHSIGVETFILDWAKRFRHHLRYKFSSRILLELLKDMPVEQAHASVLVTDSRRISEGIIVKPCCQWFLMHNQKSITAFDGRVYRIWFAQHSSYNENLQLIKLLKPKQISECVLQTNQLRE